MDLLANFESICEHMVEKFDNKDAKNGNFINQMEFRKKSIIASPEKPIPNVTQKLDLG